MEKVLKRDGLSAVSESGHEKLKAKQVLKHHVHESDSKQMGSGFPNDISSIRLVILNLSNTSIKSLPASISSLVALREFFLRGCALLMELPPEIGALKNLKVFDFEGTEVICLPKEIAELTNLECLKGSLYGYADHYQESKGIAAIIPRMTFSKLTKLKVLSIDVHPDGEWWDAEVKGILDELSSLSNLESLKLYLPTAQSLEQFLQLTRNQQFLCSALSRFRLIVGCHEQYFVSHIPDNLEEEFEKLDKCLKDINGEGNTNVIGKALEHTTALFLDGHWIIEDLSTFKVDDLHKLKFCLLRECNEMQTVVDGGKYYNEGTDYLGEKSALGSLEYLGVYYMEKLQSIWNGPICSGSLSSLGTLALHTCPNLTTIFTLGLLRNLINLKDLLVEDCPKVSSLVSLDSSCLETNHFLPGLTKMSLLDLPELMNLSSGLYIAPKLETLVVINCAKLRSFSPTEGLSEDLKEIKGESEWWDGLMWHESKWSSGRPDYLVRAFLPLGSDGDLMDKSEKDGKKLPELMQDAESLPTKSLNPSSESTSQKSEHQAQMKKVVLEVELHNDKEEQKAMERVSSLSGVKSWSINKEENTLTLTLIGDIEPIEVFDKLIQYWQTEILLFGPAKEPEKKKDEFEMNDDKKMDPTEQMKGLIDVGSDGDLMDKSEKNGKKLPELMQDAESLPTDSLNPSSEFTSQRSEHQVGKKLRLRKLELKLDLHDDKEKQKALKKVTGLPGIESVSFDKKEKKLTVIGNVDPVAIVMKLRKYWRTEILSIGPAK